MVFLYWFELFEETKAGTFESYLNTRYKDLVSSQTFSTLRDVVDSAKMIEKNKMDDKKATEVHAQLKAKVGDKCLVKKPFYLNSRVRSGRW